MYETMMNSLRMFLGSGPLRLALLVAIPLIVLGLIAAASPTVREWQRLRRERGGWLSGLCDIASGIFKLLLVFVLARLIMVIMVFQSDVFAHRHGEVTETNRSAVLMKWGLPHEQRELSVLQTVKRTWVTRQLKLPGEKGEIRQESYWADQEKPVAAIGGQLPQVVSVSSEEKECGVGERSIVSADVNVALKNNPRTLGNANYAGYEDLWTFKYVVANRSEKETTANFVFPLPAARGVFNRLQLRVDGQDMLGSTKTGSSDEGDEDSGANALRWSAVMKPGQERMVELSYESRGLEHLRYIPRRMTQTGHYRVAMEITGIKPSDLDFPIGSMPPDEKLGELKAAPFTLHWNLDNALTSYDIGVKLPAPVQPNYHFAMLLREAPVGLVLLMVILVVPRLVVGEPVSLLVISILAVAYCLFYTFMGTVADIVSGFVMPFCVAAILLSGVVAGFRLAGGGSRLLAWQDSIGFAALAVLYPLAIVDVPRTGLWMQVLYLVVLVYLVSLIVIRRVSAGNSTVRR